MTVLKSFDHSPVHLITSPLEGIYIYSLTLSSIKKLNVYFLNDRTLANLVPSIRRRHSDFKQLQRDEK